MSSETVEMNSSGKRKMVYLEVGLYVAMNCNLDMQNGTMMYHSKMLHSCGASSFVLLEPLCVCVWGGVRVCVCVREK